MSARTPSGVDSVTMSASRRAVWKRLAVTSVLGATVLTVVAAAGLRSTFVTPVSLDTVPPTTVPVTESTRPPVTTSSTLGVPPLPPIPSGVSVTTFVLAQDNDFTALLNDQATIVVRRHGDALELVSAAPTDPRWALQVVRNAPDGIVLRLVDGVSPPRIWGMYVRGASVTMYSGVAP